MISLYTLRLHATELSHSGGAVPACVYQMNAALSQMILDGHTTKSNWVRGEFSHAQKAIRNRPYAPAMRLFAAALRRRCDDDSFNFHCVAGATSKRQQYLIMILEYPVQQ